MLITHETTRADFVAQLAGITKEQAEQAIEAVADSMAYFGLSFLVGKPQGGWAKWQDMTAEEKALLRPVAETLAMLHGNAFFGTSLDDSGDDNWYEQYLPEAKALFDANGGMRGWAGEASFAKRLRE